MGPQNGSGTPEMDSNQSGAVGGIILGVFQGPLTHLGASRRLRGQRYIEARFILGHILTFFDPPCQPGQIFWSKIACTGVLHIVLHVSCGTRTSWGYFRPSEVRFRGILDPNTPILSFWILNLHIIIGQFQKRSTMTHVVLYV